MTMGEKKGVEAEEALRMLFLSLGYFAVRAIPFEYESFEVTDIDLWLYQRTSLLARERINVDVKRKKTPQAIERIFWTKGLQTALGLERSIVATTDKRRATVEFGEQTNVLVLDGNYLRTVVNHYADQTDRITEEALLSKLNVPLVLDSKLNFKRLYLSHKQILISELNFNGTNILLDQIGFLMKEYIASNQQSEASIRLLNLFISYFLILLDYASYNLAHLEQNVRRKALTDGLRYGGAGEKRANEIIQMASKLFPSFLKTSVFTDETELQKTIAHQMERIPVEPLADYFSRNEVHRKLFTLARKFESYAFSVQLIKPNQVEPEEKAIIGLLSDFFSLDRRSLI